MKKLKDFVACDYDIDIVGIADDSRDVKNGYLFVATKGYNVDHYDYINDAIKNGAVAVVADRKVNVDVPVIMVQNINDYFFEVCLKFFDLDLDYFNFIGVTGTDGKTTTTSIVKQLLNSVEKTAYIGTNGAECENERMTLSNTTPCTFELCECLKFIRDKNVKNVVMEVSSEALLHDRVKSINYSIVGFTNITEDHLNIHKTMENYISSKKKLVNYLDKDGIAIVNGDDKNCRDIDCLNKISFGFKTNNDCVISNISEKKDKTMFDIRYLGNTYKIVSPLVGIYNVYNLTMAFLICYHYGLSPDYLVSQIQNLKVIEGRREILDFGQKFDIILDYAHTYNGIVNVMESCKGYKNLIVVTGCAGGREHEKRRIIGKYILEHCDTAIFTMDDPRYENVDDIIDDMVSDSNRPYIRIIDRREAIHKAFDIAQDDSAVLIIGKGRDHYMAIEDKKVYYCDYDVIEEYFK